MTVDPYQVLPDLPPEQFAALKADIAERGVMVAVEVDEHGQILDGHNRIRACRELGINDYPVVVRSGLSDVEKRIFARKANVLRRHLSRDQVRDLIGAQLRETPEWANNRIAQALGVDDKTVATVRAGLIATSEIPKLEKLVGVDGKERPVRRLGGGHRKQAVRDDDRDNPVRDDDWDNPVKVAKFEHAIDLIEMGADPNSEKVVELLHEASRLIIGDRSYDPFAHCDEAGKHGWVAFILFLVRHWGWKLKGAAPHVEYLLQKQFKNPAEWLGEEGRKFRSGWGGSEPSEKFHSDWTTFLATQANRTTTDIESELNNIAEEEG
jgi:ParB-like chromosome segregation protein Spo0J